MKRLGLALFLASCAIATPREPAQQRSPAATPPSTPIAAIAPVISSTPIDPPAPLEKKPGVRMPGAWHAEQIAPDERDGAARTRRLPIVTKLFADAGVAFPPADLLFRVFKKEFELEVWASGVKGEPMTRIATYGVCTMSGGLGPKRKEGDNQVPEGFYVLHYYWPNSNFLLEMKIGYPNNADACLPEKEPGGAVMIHGGCASIGCVAMGDEHIEELWVMATAVDDSGKNPVHVHIFPARDFAPLLADTDMQKHWAFWGNLKEGLDRFEDGHRRPIVTNDWRGRYLFR